MNNKFQQAQYKKAMAKPNEHRFQFHAPVEPLVLFWDDMTCEVQNSDSEISNNMNEEDRYYEHGVLFRIQRFPPKKSELNKIWKTMIWLINKHKLHPDHFSLVSDRLWDYMKRYPAIRFEHHPVVVALEENWLTLEKFHEILRLGFSAQICTGRGRC